MMKFLSEIHGTSIQLSSDLSSATNVSSFSVAGNSLVFSSSCLSVGSWIGLEVHQSRHLSGCLRLGITTSNPTSINATSLPHFSLPDLNKWAGFWMRSIPECLMRPYRSHHYHQTHSGTSKKTLASGVSSSDKNGCVIFVCRITLIVNASGELHYFVNGIHRGVLIHDLPTNGTKLWLLADLFGNTQHVKLVPAMERPSEIIARGPTALSAYQRACESGTRPVHRTRLMLVGEDGCGKTSLKKALMGDTIRPVPDESPSSIELGSSCTFSSDGSDGTSWRTALPPKRSTSLLDIPFETDPIEEEENEEADNSMPLPFDILEDETNLALAENLALQLLVEENMSSTSEPSRISRQKPRVSIPGYIESPQKKTPNQNIDAATDTDVTTTVKESSTSSLPPTPPPEPSEAILSLANHLVTVAHWRSSQLRNHQAKISGLKAPDKETDGPAPLLNPPPPDVTLHMWDFAGQAAYYTTHQVFLTHRAVYIIVFNLTHNPKDPADHPLGSHLNQTSSKPSESSSDAPQSDPANPGSSKRPFTHLDYIEHWIQLIHLHAARLPNPIPNSPACQTTSTSDYKTPPTSHMFVQKPSLLSPRKRGFNGSSSFNRSGSIGTIQSFPESSDESVHENEDFNNRNRKGGARMELESKNISIIPLVPPIILVGTHAGLLGSTPEEIEKKAAERFNEIHEYLRYKTFYGHIVSTYFTVENKVGSDVNTKNLTQLREKLKTIVREQPYMGEMIPVKWLKLERRIADLVARGNNMVTISQMTSLGQEEHIYGEDELLPALEFLHDLGIIVYLGKAVPHMSGLQQVVILNPKWLLDCFRTVVSTQASPVDLSIRSSDAWSRLCESAILEERLLDHYWNHMIHQKPVLIGLMERFDLIAERAPYSSTQTIGHHSVERSFFVPSLLQPWNSESGEPEPSDAVVFYLKFNFLPDGLFQRLLTRCICWSQELGGGDPVLRSNKAWFFVDQEHDFALEKESFRENRVKVAVYKVGAHDDNPIPGIPNSRVTAKVRHFLESMLEELRQLWVKRMFYTTGVSCPCSRTCRLHRVAGCQKQECVHLLPLDECLTAKVVCCGHRRIKTDQWQQWFPDIQQLSSLNHSDFHGAPIIPDHVIGEDVWNIEVQKGQYIPQWMKSAAKLLSGAKEGQDFQALALRLGYNEAGIMRFNEDLNPALFLLADWVISNGNTGLAVDMIVVCLQQMARNDIAEIIEADREGATERCKVFLSYQWDSQDSVRQLRDYLERSGFSCWIDIGQMGGGDILHERIEKALRHCKVIIACITPKYTVSSLCHRELALGDLLRKPIIPVLLERTVWPPPGGTALLLAHCVYVDLDGVGGHGGSGVHADKIDKYAEIVAQISKYTEPDPNFLNMTSSDKKDSLSLNDTTNLHRKSSQSSERMEPDGSILPLHSPRGIESGHSRQNMGSFEASHPHRDSLLSHSLLLGDQNIASVMISGSAQAVRTSNPDVNEREGVRLSHQRGGDEETVHRQERGVRRQDGTGQTDLRGCTVCSIL